MRKITFFLTLMVAMVTTAMAQSYKLTETRLSSSDLNSKTEPTLIAIKNLSKTNSYWFVGNTAGAPYSAAEFSNDAVFVWEPVVEGVPGVAYSLKKLDGTYMTSTSPTTFVEDKNAAAPFKTTNPTVANGEFNGDGDTVYDDESWFVRFVTGGKWINVQNGDAGTPVYNNGLGGWTLHNVYLVEESDDTEQPTPEQPVVTPGIEADKLYRIKSTTAGNYMAIRDENANTHGHVYGADFNADDKDQIFSFIPVENEENNYFVVSLAGKYISEQGTGYGWNVNYTEDASQALKLTFVPVEGAELQYIIKCYNSSKAAECYFKYEYVGASGKYHPYNDAAESAAEVWALEEATAPAPVEPDPEQPGVAEGELVLDLTAEQIGTTYPYQLSAEDAAKVFALNDITVAVKFNTAGLDGRKALFATSDPTKAVNTDAMGTNSYYVAYGMNNKDLGYLASWRTGDRYTAGNIIPTYTEGNVAVFVINPTNNNFRSYLNGQNIADRNFGTYEIATPAMVKADYADANIYIGGGMNASGAGEVFDGQIVGVKVFNGALTEEEIAAISFESAPVEPELEALEATNATRNPAESDWDPSKSYYLQGVKLDFAEAVKKADGVTEFGCIYDANGEVVAVINKILGANGTAKYATPYVATKITTAGTYKVVVYPGVILSADGAKEYKGGEFEFVVAKKPATLIPSAEDGLFYNASFASVEEFKTQQIIVSGADEVTVSEDVKITMTSGENVYTATVTVEDKDGNKVINIVFPDEDYAVGRYTINIPEGAFLVDGVANAEYYASNFTYNKPQLKVTKDWTSWEALFTEKYMMPREVAIAINNAEAVTVAEGMVATLTVGETTYNSTVSFTSEENNYWISFKFAEIEAIYENEDADFVKGEYTFTVPAGLYTVNGEANVEETRVFTYGDAVVEEFSVTSVSPAVGDVTELNRIEIAFSNNTKPEQLILTNGDERFFFIAKDGAYVAVDPLKDYAEITITELGTYTLDLSELDGLTGDKVFSWTVVEAVEEPVDYTPTYTGTVDRNDRNVTAVTLGDNIYNLLTPEQSSCYVDATETVTFTVVAGATVKASVEHKGEWVHHALYIDFDGDGFTSGLEEGSEWKPAGDLVSYAFYNNGSSSDEYGYNSVGTYMSDMDRHMPKMPEFVAPTEPGLYRIRFVQDWCSIDPNGDSDGKFGDFMGNGGQIIDVMLEVVEPITEGIDSVDAEAENAVIYDLTGRKIEKVTKAGIYIINGVKKVVK